MTLLPVAEAQARILALAAPLPVERVPLLHARGQVLAEPMPALRDQPWADLSAMDGYAVRHADMPGPWTITGESRAGGPPPQERLCPGEAMRIFTGAPLPEGADCVLVQEDSRRDGDQLSLAGEGPSGPGRHVRHRGSDFTRDAPLLQPGTRIGAAHIALAAVSGHDRLAVHRRPRVAILSTGDELAAPGHPLLPGQLPASNGVMLAAMLTQEGAEVIDLGIVADNAEALRIAFAKAAREADVIVSTGGASVGDHDLVAPAIAEAGGALDFWKVAMRPGKPMMAGTLGAAIVLGLPGNPVSAFVTATLFLLPLVRRCLGVRNPLPPVRIVNSAIALPPGDSRAEYLRGWIEGDRLVALRDRDSAGLHALATANALVERPAAAPAVAEGDTVPIIPLTGDALA